MLFYQFYYGKRKMASMKKRRKTLKNPCFPSLLYLTHIFFSAGGGTRTHTPGWITDFESVSSANSDTPAFSLFRWNLYYNIIHLLKLQVLFLKF